MTRERCINCLELKSISKMYFDPEIEAYFCNLEEAAEYKTTQVLDKYEKPNK